MQVYWLQWRWPLIRWACSPLILLPLQFDDHPLLRVRQICFRQEVHTASISLCALLHCYLWLIRTPTLGRVTSTEIHHCTADSSMRVSLRLPSRSLCVWALTLSALVQCGCDARICESDGHPMVALLFLTRSGIPHKDLWKRWLSSAANLTGAAFVQNQLCTRGQSRDCEHSKQPSHAFGQRLFSLYIHSGSTRQTARQAQHSPATSLPVFTFAAP